jgi:hypothetical protein
VVRFVLLLALVLSVRAEDDPLAALRATLLPMREHPDEHLESRGATAQLTVAKHQLRDWIETSLARLGENGDEAALVRELNAVLSKEKFLCDYSMPGADDRCPDEKLLGFLGGIRIRRQLQFLVVETAIGIQCGYDESAYIYEWAGERWQRRWESEQDNYAEKQYFPQMLDAVRISLPDKKGSQLVLMLGREPWCASNWHDVYYRLWRIGPRDQSTKLLLEGSEWAFVENGIQGTVGPDEALIEYATMSLDKGILINQTVQHYRIDGDKVERTAPLALSPRDFTDEWLTQPWSLSVAWSEPAGRAMLQQWHQRLHSDSPNGEFDYPTLHCPQNPDLWQVGINLDPASGKGKRIATYFLVRWRPPYRFSMVNISSRPFPGCTEKDREADAPRTLFPGQ